MISPHFSPQELAQRWHLAAGTLAKWRSQGIGPVYLRLGNRIVYRVDDIDAFEAKALHASTATRVEGGSQ